MLRSIVHATRQQLINIGLAATMLATTLLTTAAPLQAAGGQPSAFLDQATVAWASVRGLSSSEYHDDWEARKNAGYLPIDQEVIELDGAAHYAAVWQKNDGRGWASRRDLTAAEFDAAWTEYTNDGMRLIDQDSYVVNDTRYYTGIWIENKEHLDWLSYRSLTDQQFHDYYTQYRAEGWLLVDVEGFPTGDGMRYSQIWVKNTEHLDWVEWRDLTSESYGAKFDEYKQSGYRVMDLESYTRNGVQNYAAIWIKNDGRGWYAYRDMTAKAYGDRWMQLRDAGYRLVDFEIYATADGPRYAGVWRQNSDRPTWALKDAVTNAVQSYVDSNAIPGLTVVIAQNGQFDYLRGFGYGNVETEQIAHSRTVYRLASVSKAVAGVLSMRLQEQNQISLATPIRDYAPTLPTLHTETMGQLLSNRGCVRHYISNDPVNNQDNQYATALAAAPLFWNDPLVCTPDSYFYSTHGYTLLGAGMEGATNKSVATLVKEQIADALDLPTLLAENRSQSVKYRAATYSSGNPVDPDNISWKVLGGGLEASAYDLARLGMKILNHSAMSAASRTAMWLPPNNASNYAFGWNTGTDQGTPVVAKDGAQTGSRAYMRMYPDKGYVIVLLSNQRGHDLPSLGRQIGTLLLDAENAAMAAGATPIQPIVGNLMAADETEGEDELLGSLGKLHLVLPIVTKPVTPIRALPGANLGESGEDQMQIENPVVPQPPSGNNQQAVFLPLVMK